ncbi:MAG: LysM peptidoglycan-binding domain-containing protein, partial [Chthonomonadales bacterium]|nr:LysM peptidoglycan-binding domain-containing protein [Chthonomonadales bacterium]
GATATARTSAAEPSISGGAQRSIPHVPAPAVAPLPDRMPRVATSMVGVGPVEPGRRAAASVPPTVRVKRGETLTDVSRKTGVSPAEIARLNNVKAGPNATLPEGRSLIVPQMGAFDVAFDGVVLAFDVAPRVQAGIGLAPIRQIFEHTGGRLYWYPGKPGMVRAVNDTREIELRIGSPSAVVNNRMITLERSPFIESGRTLVPLTFVRDALEVNVQYDANSGRMLLRTK